MQPRPPTTHSSTPARPSLAARLSFLALVGVLVALAGVLPATVTAAPPRAPVAALPLGCSELVQNGSFEQLNVAWNILPSDRPGTYDSLQRFDGAYSMRLGITDLPNLHSISEVQQTINLPANANAIILTFRYFPQFNGTPGAGDLQYAQIFNNNNGQFISRPLQTVRDDRAWLLGQYDLTALRGQQIRLVFGVQNDGANANVAMNVDAVSIAFCTATPTPTGTPVTPTATPSPTPITPTFTPVPGLPAGCVQMLSNGGFEDDSTWIRGEAPNLPQFVGSTKYEGLRSIQLGNPSTLNPDRFSFSSVRQIVNLPSTASTAELRWWHFHRTEEAPTESVGIGVDRQEVILLNPDLSTLAVLYRVLRNEGGFAQEVVDLTPYRGRSFYVYFNTFNDGNGRRTWMFLDNVSLCAFYPGGVAAPWVAWTPSATPSALPTLTATPTNMAMAPMSEAAMAVGAVAPITDLSAGGNELAASIAASQPVADGVPVADVALTAETPQPLTAGAEVVTDEQVAAPDAVVDQTPRWVGIAGVLCGIVLIIGLLVLGIVRVISRDSS